MTDLAELLERVKAATGPDADFELGYDITNALLPNGKSHSVAFDRRCTILAMTEPTRSVDTALALVELMLPGTGRELAYVPGNDPPYDVTLWVEPRRVWVSHRSEPLAILAALLSALIALAAQDSVGSAQP